MDFDDLTKKLGQFGKYQRMIYFLACFVGFPAAFNNMGIVFIAGAPKHWCTSPELSNLTLSDDLIKNVTIPLEEKDDQLVYSSCKRYSREYGDWSVDDVWDVAVNGDPDNSTEECPHGWSYDTSIYTSTIVSQWDLVCDDRWLQATASSVYMAGLMVGVLLLSSLSDIVGRRPTFIAALLGSVIFAFSLSFTPNFIAFCVLRFLTGFFTIGVFTIGFVMGMELIGPDYRMHTGIGIEYYWAIGYMAYALIAYFIRDWYTLNLVASGCLIPILALIFVLPESPRWLYVHGKTEQADAIIRKAAKFNKVQLPQKLVVTVKKDRRGYVWDLLRTKRMACRSVNIAYNWMVNSCVYYGLSLNTSNLGGNDFVNFAISAGVEIPAYIMCQVALHYGGRRWPLCVTMVIGGVSLLCILAVPADLNWVAVTLSMIGKFCISASFAIIYVFTAELYPTTVRNIGVGTGSFFARIGGVIAPYIGQLSDISFFIPMVVFGVMSVTAGFLSLAFPETKGQNLPETLEDGENFGLDVSNEKTEDPEAGSTSDINQSVVDTSDQAKTNMTENGIEPSVENIKPDLQDTVPGDQKTDSMGQDNPGFADIDQSTRM